MGTTYNHNSRVLKGLQPGDLVEFDRDWYNHWGVYIGNEEVVHFTGNILLSSGSQTPKVRRDNFWDVATGSRANKNNKKDGKYRPLKPWQIVKRAKEMVGKFISYDVFSRNCEHFASFCRYGKGKSEQVDNLLTGLAIGGAAVAVGGLLAGVLAGHKDKNS